VTDFPLDAIEALGTGSSAYLKEFEGLSDVAVLLQLFVLTYTPSAYISLSLKEGRCGQEV
jgi:hypothetical protein